MPGPHVEGKRSFTGKLRAAYVRPLHGGYSVGVSLSVVDSLGVTGSGTGAGCKTALQREHTTLPSDCVTPLCPSAADSSVFVSPQLHR
jgi:hypothetical protein